MQFSSQTEATDLAFLNITRPLDRFFRVVGGTLAADLRRVVNGQARVVYFYVVPRTDDFEERSCGLVG